MKWEGRACILFTVIVMNRIKELRSEKKLTQSDLAKALDVARTTMANYETEARQLDPQTIRKLCAFFGCTADYLLGLSSRRENAVSAAEAELLQAYKDASDRDRKLVDDILAAYKKETPAAAG